MKVTKERRHRPGRLRLTVGTWADVVEQSTARYSCAPADGFVLCRVCPWFQAVEEALKRNSTDNISVVVICFNGKRPSKRYGSESSMRNCMSSGAISRLGEFLGQ
eukprot:scaffold21466_cov34-Prasinocladus_malaysianus.AAC.2